MTKVIKTFIVEGMSCSHCEKSVKQSVGALNGVENVTVNLNLKKVTVEYDSELVGPEAIKDAIEDQGYDVEEE